MKNKKFLGFNWYINALYYTVSIAILSIVLIFNISFWIIIPFSILFCMFCHGIQTNIDKRIAINKLIAGEDLTVDENVLIFRKCFEGKEKYSVTFNKNDKDFFLLWAKSSVKLGLMYQKNLDEIELKLKEIED